MDLRILCLQEGQDHGQRGGKTLEQEQREALVQYYKNVANYVKNSQIMIRDPNKNTFQNTSYFKYTKDQIIKALENPGTNEKLLRQMSQYLYNTSCQYSRLIQYFANMLTFPYIITPINVDPQNTDAEKVRLQYEKVKRKLENMNFRHEFGKVLGIAFRDDVFYGYVHETKDSFAIQALDPDYCKIVGTEDGVFQFAWDCNFFRSNESLKDYYPEELTEAYDQYKNNNGQQWITLNSKNSICIKINEDTITPIPPFVSLFSSLADIEDYKAISKNASEISNYKALAMIIPVDDEGHPILDEPTIRDYYDMMVDVLPPNIAGFLTPMKVQDYVFEKSGAMSDTDLVSDAEDQFWRQAGVNSLIFGSGNDPSSTTIQTSIHADEAICFRVLRQIERWVNRQLKMVTGSVKFSVRFLDVTVYNWREMQDSLLKLGMYGIPVRTAVSAVANITPPMYENLLYMENDVLRLYEKEVPLQSSNTISGEVGHPTNESKGLPLSDNGEESAENR